MSSQQHLAPANARASETPLRVALLGRYPIDGAPTGGTENICYQLAALLNRRPELEIHVVCPAPTLSENRVFEVDGVHVYAVAYKGILPDSINHYFKLPPRYTQVLRELAPDLAHAQLPTCGLWALEAGIPTVFTIHGIQSKEEALVKGLRRLMSGLHLHFFNKAMRKAPFIISISPYAQQELESLSDAEFIYVPNPVNPRFFELDPERREEGRVLFVGSLIERKCIAELLEAFRGVHQKHPEAQLHLVGKQVDPKYFQQLTCFVAENDLHDVVRFAGAVSNEEIHDEFERASIVVLMSRQETAPGIIGEAMAAGKAVVSSRICGIPYMVDEEETGLLAADGDIEGFGQQIQRLLDDPALCRELGAQGRRKALETFHPEHVVGETVRVYHQVIESSRS